MAKKNNQDGSQEMSPAEMRRTMAFLLRQDKVHDARLQRLETRTERLEAWLEKSSRDFDKRFQDFDKRFQEFDKRLKASAAAAEKRDQQLDRRIQNVAGVIAELNGTVSTLYDMQAKTIATLDVLSAAQAETTDKLNALIGVVDGLVRDKYGKNGERT